MPTPQRDYITRGAGHISIAALGADLPASLEDAQALVAGTFAGWSPIGDTSTAVTIKENLEHAETQSTQRLRPSALHITKAGATVETSALAVTARRLAESTEGVLTESTGMYVIDGLQAPRQATYYSLAVVGPAGRAGTTLWVAECVAYSGDDIETAYTREEDTVLALAWAVLEGSVLPGGTRRRVWGLTEDEIAGS